MMIKAILTLFFAIVPSAAVWSQPSKAVTDLNRAIEILDATMERSFWPSRFPVRYWRRSMHQRRMYMTTRCGFLVNLYGPTV